LERKIMSDDHPAPSAEPKPKATRGGFFIVDRGMFHKACALGLRPAIALLILARFTQGRGATSRASSNAIEKRTGIGRKAAREAIGALEKDGIVTRSGSPTRPVHRITRHLDLPDPRGAISERQQEAFTRVTRKSRDAALNPLKASTLNRNDAAIMGNLERVGHVRRVGHEWEAVPRDPGEPVWLPNELVDGVNGNPSPVELIRQTGDPMTLRLLVDLYTAHRLDEWHGVDPRIICGTFEEVYRREVGAALVVAWVPTKPRLRCGWGNTVTDPHEGDAQNLEGAFYERLGVLERLGLLTFVPHVVDGDGAPVYPCSRSVGHPLELELGAAAVTAAESILDARSRGGREEPPDLDWSEIIAVVPAHMARASLVGVARLAFRPKTAMTAAWLSDLGARHAEWMGRFGSTALGETQGIAKARTA
jgi:hypothetical protein